jgi:hypothetical protein
VQFLEDTYLTLLPVKGKPTSAFMYVCLQHTHVVICDGRENAQVAAISNIVAVPFVLASLYLREYSAIN